MVYGGPNLFVNIPHTVNDIFKIVFIIGSIMNFLRVFVIMLALVRTKAKKETDHITISPFR